MIRKLYARFWLWKNGYCPHGVKYQIIPMVNNETGAEIAPAGLKFIAEANGLRPAEYFDRPVSGLLEENTANEEGYVLAYHVGDGVPLRVKIKYASYCALHRLLHQTSTVSVWEAMCDGKDLEAIAAQGTNPFYLWFVETVDRIREQKDCIENQAHYAFHTAPKNVSRKEFAEYAKKHGVLTPLLFSLLDGRDITDMVWKMVRPTSAQPFKQEEA